MVRNPLHRSALPAIVLGAALGLCSGCATSSPGSSSDSPADKSVITVFAASSLSGAFAQLERNYETANPGSDVQISFGSSDQLVAQIADGAEVDLVATADRATALRVAGDLPIQRFAGNSLSIITDRSIDTPTSLTELQQSSLTVVVGAPDTPIGRYTADALNQADVTLKPKSYEPNAKAVLSKVRLGEVDAAIVYSSDARTAGDRYSFSELPESGTDIELDAVVLEPRGNDLLKLLISDDGQQILRSNGFEP
jgi:molybdate transport system substrate-binding protein